MNSYFFNYKNKRCLLLGSKGAIGKSLIKFCIDNDITFVTLDSTNKNEVSEGLFKSCDSVSANEAFLNAMDTLKDVDFILCSYDFEDFRFDITGDELNPDRWNEILGDWCMNQFIVLKAAVTRFNDGKKRRIVYFNSNQGCPEEREGVVTPGGSLHEAACSGGIMGMMTSIARSIIPNGWSVNGIAYDKLDDEEWPKIEWGLNLWLSGMGEYSCGETYKII